MRICRGSSRRIRQNPIIVKIPGQHKGKSNTLLRLLTHVNMACMLSPYCTKKDTCSKEKVPGSAYTTNRFFTEPQDSLSSQDTCVAIWRAKLSSHFHGSLSDTYWFLMGNTVQQPRYPYSFSHTGTQCDQ